MPRQKKIIKFIAGMLVLAFFASECSHAAYDTAFAKPQPSALIQNKLIQMDLPASMGVVEDSFLADQSQSAERMGQGKADGSFAMLSAPCAMPTLYLIQDAHTNESCQTSIVRILDLLMNTNSSPIPHPSSPKPFYVFLEAGTGDDSLSHLREKGSLKAREIVGNSWLKKGELKGCEYLDITSDKPIKLWGVEDKSLYFKSVSLYEEIVEKRESFQDYLNHTDATIRLIKTRIFNPLLLAFDQKVQDNRNQKISITDYLDYLLKQASLHGLSLKAYPVLKQLKKLKKKESQINFDKANQEQQKLIEYLPKEKAQELMQAAKSQKNTHPLKLTADNEKQTQAFYTLIEEYVCQPNLFATLKHAVIPAKAGISLKADPRLRGDDKPKRSGKQTSSYPHLSKYIQYLKDAKNLKAKELLKEQKILEETLYNRLLLDEDEKNLYLCDQGNQKLYQLFELKLTPEEFQIYKNNKEHFNIQWMTGFLNRKITDLRKYYENFQYLKAGFEDYVQKAEDFYELTKQRDERFVENLLNKMQESDGDFVIPAKAGISDRLRAVALIVGGYHTSNLKEILRRKNISFVSITPQTLKETNQKRYEKILLKRANTYQKQHTLGLAAADKVDCLPAAEGLAAARLADEIVRMDGVIPRRQGIGPQSHSRSGIWGDQLFAGARMADDDLDNPYKSPSTVSTIDDLSYPAVKRRYIFTHWLRFAAGSVMGAALLFSMLFSYFLYHSWSDPEFHDMIGWNLTHLLILSSISLITGGFWIFLIRKEIRLDAQLSTVPRPKEVSRTGSRLAEKGHVTDRAISRNEGIGSKSNARGLFWPDEYYDPAALTAIVPQWRPGMRSLRLKKSLRKGALDAIIEEVLRHNVAAVMLLAARYDRRIVSMTKKIKEPYLRQEARQYLRERLPESVKKIFQSDKSKQWKNGAIGLKLWNMMNAFIKKERTREKRQALYRDNVRNSEGTIVDALQKKWGLSREEFIKELLTIISGDRLKKITRLIFDGNEIGEIATKLKISRRTASKLRNKIIEIARRAWDLPRGNSPGARLALHKPDLVRKPPFRTSSKLRVEIQRDEKTLRKLFAGMRWTARKAGWEMSNAISDESMKRVLYHLIRNIRQHQYADLKDHQGEPVKTPLYYRIYISDEPDAGEGIRIDLWGPTHPLVPLPESMKKNKWFSSADQPWATRLLIDRSIFTRSGNSIFSLFIELDNDEDRTLLKSRGKKVLIGWTEDKENEGPEPGGHYTSIFVPRVENPKKTGASPPKSTSDSSGEKIAPARMAASQGVRIAGPTPRASHLVGVELGKLTRRSFIVAMLSVFGGGFLAYWFWPRPIGEKDVLQIECLPVDNVPLFFTEEFWIQVKHFKHGASCDEIRTKTSESDTTDIFSKARQCSPELEGMLIRFAESRSFDERTRIIQEMNFRFFAPAGAWLYYLERQAADGSWMPGLAEGHLEDPSRRDAVRRIRVREETVYLVYGHSHPYSYPIGNIGMTYGKTGFIRLPDVRDQARGIVEFLAAIRDARESGRKKSPSRKDNTDFLVGHFIPEELFAYANMHPRGMPGLNRLHAAQVQILKKAFDGKTEQEIFEIILQLISDHETAHLLDNAFRGITDETSANLSTLAGAPIRESPEARALAASAMAGFAFMGGAYGQDCARGLERVAKKASRDGVCPAPDVEETVQGSLAKIRNRSTVFFMSPSIAAADILRELNERANILATQLEAIDRLTPTQRQSVAAEVYKDLYGQVPWAALRREETRPSGARTALISPPDPARAGKLSASDAGTRNTYPRDGIGINTNNLNQNPTPRGGLSDKAAARMTLTRVEGRGQRIKEMESYGARIAIWDERGYQKLPESLKPYKPFLLYAKDYLRHEIIEELDGGEIDSLTLQLAQNSERATDSIRTVLLKSYYTTSVSRGEVYDYYLIVLNADKNKPRTLGVVQLIDKKEEGVFEIMVLKAIARGQAIIQRGLTLGLLNQRKMRQLVCTPCASEAIDMYKRMARDERLYHKVWGTTYTFWKKERQTGSEPVRLKADADQDGIVGARIGGPQSARVAPPTLRASHLVGVETWPMGSALRAYRYEIGRAGEGRAAAFVVEVTDPAAVTVRQFYDRDIVKRDLSESGNPLTAEDGENGIVGKIYGEWASMSEKPEAVLLTAPTVECGLVVQGGFLIVNGKMVARTAPSYFGESRGEGGWKPLNGTFSVVSLDPDSPGIFDVYVKNGKIVGECPVRNGFSGALLLENGENRLNGIHFGDSSKMHGPNYVPWSKARRAALSAYGVKEGHTVLIQAWRDVKSGTDAQDMTIDEFVSFLKTIGVRDAILAAAGTEVGARHIREDGVRENFQAPGTSILHEILAGPTGERPVMAVAVFEEKQRAKLVYPKHERRITRRRVQRLQELHDWLTQRDARREPVEVEWVMTSESLRTAIEAAKKWKGMSRRAQAAGRKQPKLLITGGMGKGTRSMAELAKENDIFGSAVERARTQEKVFDGINDLMDEFRQFKKRDPAGFWKYIRERFKIRPGEDRAKIRRIRREAAEGQAQELKGAGGAIKVPGESTWEFTCHYGGREMFSKEELAVKTIETLIFDRLLDPKTRRQALIPEAILYYAIARAYGVPDEVILIETHSTTSRENIRSGAKALKDAGESPRSVLLLQNPIQMRRGKGAFLKIIPAVMPGWAGRGRVYAWTPFRYNISEYLETKGKPEFLRLEQLILTEARLLRKHHTQGKILLEEDIPPRIHRLMRALDPESEEKAGAIPPKIAPARMAPGQTTEDRNQMTEKSAARLAVEIGPEAEGQRLREVESFVFAKGKLSPEAQAIVDSQKDALKSLLLDQISRLPKGARRSGDCAIRLVGDRASIFYFRTNRNRTRAFLRMRGVNRPIVSISGDLRSELARLNALSPQARQREIKSGLDAMTGIIRVNEKPALRAPELRFATDHRLSLEYLESVTDHKEFIAQVQLLTKQITWAHRQPAHKDSIFYLSDTQNLSRARRGMIASLVRQAKAGDFIRIGVPSDPNRIVARYILADNLKSKYKTDYHPDLAPNEVAVYVSGPGPGSYALWDQSFLTGAAVAAAARTRFINQKIEYENVDPGVILEGIFPVYKTPLGELITNQTLWDMASGKIVTIDILIRYSQNIKVAPISISDIIYMARQVDMAA